LFERRVFDIKMNVISKKQEETILHFLKLQGCCLRCCLRFIGNRTYCNSESAVQVSLINKKRINNINMNFSTNILIKFVILSCYLNLT